MNRIKNIVFALGMGVIVGGSTASLVVTSSATALPPTKISDCSQNFLTFPTWFRGLVDVKAVNGVNECVIKSPNDVGGLTKFITIIALNVVEMGLQLVVYLTVFFIIWGGFQFMTSQGDPNTAAKARQTIINAAIGLVISFAAIAAVNLIFGIIK